MDQITIKAPDDWHLHFRDGQMLNETVPATARCFRRAIVMPNLVPPVTNRQQALAYRQRILQATPSTADFTPLMTLYLTDQTTAADIQEAAGEEIPAAKLYPAGATTNSDSAVKSIEPLYPVFQAMSDAGMLLLIHGEVTEESVDIFDREDQFIKRYLTPICADFPDLKVVLEHITTTQAVEFITNSGDNVAATITPQHLMLSRNDLLAGGIRPHNYCLPILKRESHRSSLRAAVSSGSSKFFLGTDSAPHSKADKENACGCAGCYSAWGALEMYTQVFDELGALDQLEAFASINGPRFYGLTANTESITLVRDSWTMPASINLPTGGAIVPFFAGQTLDWRVAT